MKHALHWSVGHPRRCGCAAGLEGGARRRGGAVAAFSGCSHIDAVRASPCRRGLARGLPEVLAQVCLVDEAASQGNVAQRRIGGEHVLSGQFDAPSHDK